MNSLAKIFIIHIVLLCSQTRYLIMTLLLVIQPYFQTVYKDFQTIYSLILNDFPNSHGGGNARNNQTGNYCIFISSQTVLSIIRIEHSPERVLELELIPNVATGDYSHICMEATDRLKDRQQS